LKLFRASLAIYELERDRSNVFPSGRSSVCLFVKVSRSRIAYPDFESRLILRLSGFDERTFYVFRFEDRVRVGLLFVNSLPESGFVS